MSSNAERFGQIVRHRREVELDSTQLDIASAGGPSNTTQTKIENGQLEELTRATARKIDAGMQWAPGSARTVWDGGDPTPLDGSRVDTRGYSWLRARVDEATDVPEPVRHRVRQVLEEHEGRRTG